MSVNKAILIGHLGQDPEVRFLASGQAVARLSVATNEKWKDAAGELKERTDWHNVVVWGKTAEHCGQYLTKGRQVYVEGSIRTRDYEKDGVKRYITEVVAQRVQFLGGGGESRASAGPGTPPGGGGGAVAPDDDDIPF
jgi:single-strand DNA-binding protein